jgi:hypothetical protein
VQALWPKSPAEQLEGLRRMEIAYYLFVPNETKHQVNRRLGPPEHEKEIGGIDPRAQRQSALRGWIGTDVLELVDCFGENCLYRFHYPAPTSPAPDTAP